MLTAAKRRGKIAPVKRLLAGFATAVLIAATSAAAEVKVEAVMAQGKDSRPTDTFTSDVPKLYAFFKSTGTKKGDSLRAVWIAEDVGSAAPKETKIDESTLTADEENFFGAFALSKPTNGWPEGKYRVDLYTGDEVATAVRFTIRRAKVNFKTEDEDENLPTSRKRVQRRLALVPVDFPALHHKADLL